MPQKTLLDIFDIIGTFAQKRIFACLKKMLVVAVFGIYNKSSRFFVGAYPRADGTQNHFIGEHHTLCFEDRRALGSCLMLGKGADLFELAFRSLDGILQL